jgi:hypothetical protein
MSSEDRPLGTEIRPNPTASVRDAEPVGTSIKQGFKVTPKTGPGWAPNVQDAAPTKDVAQTQDPKLGIIIKDLYKQRDKYHTLILILSYITIGIFLIVTIGLGISFVTDF